MPSRAEFLAGGRRRVSPVDGEAILKTNGWLSETSPEFQDAFLSKARWLWFEPGESIVIADDPISPIIGIASGSAALTTAMGPADTPLTHIAYPGWWSGTLPLVSGAPTQNSTVARTPVYAAVISQSAISALLNERPAWWRFIAILYLSYIGVALNLVADLLIRESDRRCAATILRIADCRFEGDAPAIAPVNQADLATIANLSRNTANALLRQFEEQRLVARAYNQIEILDPRSLRAIADGELEYRENT